MRTLSLILALLLPLNSWAASSLTFGALSTDNVSIAAATSINNLETKTFMLWIYPTTLGGRMLFRTCAAGNDLLEMVGAGTSNIAFVNRQTGTSQVTTTTDTPLVTNTWQFIAVTYDSGATPRGHIYYGTQTSNVAERSASQTNGTGTKSPDAANPLYVSSNAGASSSVVGQIGFFGMWNRVLTLAEIQDQQFNPHVTSGNVIFSYFGFNDTGTQYDLTGNGNNGTVTGATASSNGAPITFPQGAM